jgi:hypothetical protein
MYASFEFVAQSFKNVILWQRIQMNSLSCIFTVYFWLCACQAEKSYSDHGQSDHLLNSAYIQG